MDQVRAALRDLRRAMVFTKFFHSFMNTLIIFLACAAALLFLKRSWMYAAVPSGAYLFFMIYRIIMKTRYKDIEEAVPEFRWQLRTVSDNMHTNNEVVRSLKENVVAKTREMRTSAFIDNRVTTYKLFGIFCLSFLLVAFSAFSINFADFKGMLPTGAVTKDTSRGGAGEVNYDGDFERATDRNIYGERGVVALGTENLELEINPEQNKANLRDPQDTHDLGFDEQSQIKDIGAAPDKSYEDKFKRKESELIKQYLKKLAEYANSERR